MESSANDSSVGTERPPTARGCTGSGTAPRRLMPCDLSSLMNHNFRSVNITQSQMDMQQRTSFVLNALLLPLMAIFGIVGYATLMVVIRAFYSVWDCPLVTLSVLINSMDYWLYGVKRHYGPSAMLFYIVYPLANVSVTGTQWQVVVMTVERFWAVSRPLDARQLPRKAPMWRLIGLVFVLAILLNVPAFYYDYALQDCVLYTLRNVTDERGGGRLSRVSSINTRLYMRSGQTGWQFIVINLIPDLLFRCPTPFVLIAALTVRTLWYVRQASARRNHVGHGIALMLTIFNAKYLVCHTLNVVNLGSKFIFSHSDHSGYWHYYFYMSYSNEISNALLVFHSATNWLLFMQWPSRRDSDGCSMADSQQPLATTNGAPSPAQKLHRRHTSRQNLRDDAVLSQIECRALLSLWKWASPEQLGRDLLVAVITQNEQMAAQMYGTGDRTALEQHPQLIAAGETISAFLVWLRSDQVVRVWLQSAGQETSTNSGGHMAHLRSQLRAVGASHHKIGLKLANRDWAEWKAFMIHRLAIAARRRLEASVVASKCPGGVAASALASPIARRSRASRLVNRAMSIRWGRAATVDSEQTAAVPLRRRTTCCEQQRSRGQSETEPDMKSIADRFTSFIVYEVKSGYLCASVSACHSNATVRRRHHSSASPAKATSVVQQRKDPPHELVGAKGSGDTAYRVRDCPQEQGELARDAQR